MPQQNNQNQPNRLAVVYDPDREQLRPLAGRRSVRGFAVSWLTGALQGREPAIEEFRFEPGVNWIPATLWERIQQMLPVQQRLQWGALRPFQPREVGETETTTRYNEADAKILVDNTWDLNRLDDWLRAERRPSIVNYIQARIDSIRAGRA